LFEAQEDHYGEVWYQLGGRSVMSRSTTETVVLETLYQLAEIQPPFSFRTSRVIAPVASRYETFYGSMCGLLNEQPVLIDIVVHHGLQPEVYASVLGGHVTYRLAEADGG